MVLPFSAQSKAGREEIYEVMDRILEECNQTEE
jgi:GTP-binding protein